MGEMNLVILACDKKSACVQKITACRYCAAPRSLMHMRNAHPELVEKFRQNMADEDFKQTIGREDQVEFRPKWYKFGRKY